MNAAVVEKLGSPPKYETFADPVAGQEEVVVDIRAAGLHRIVRSIAAGAHYLRSGPVPFVPGVDGVGTLESGERVFFGATRPPYGTFAERSITKREVCTVLPEGIDDVAAAAMGNPAMSSWGALKLRARMAANDRVLVLGATGVSGTLAVQIAKRLGAARVVAAGRNHEALEKLQTIGADATVALVEDRETVVQRFYDEIEGPGIDIVLDYVWGAPAEALLAAIGKRRGGNEIRYIQIGSMAAQTVSLEGGTLRSSPLTIMGSGFGSAPIAELLRAIGEFFDEARAAPFVFDARPVPLRDVEREWSVSSSGRTVFVP